MEQEDIKKEDLNNTEENEVSTENQSTEVDKLSAELADAKDKYLRLYSEFDNFRKRTAREKTEIILHANEGLMKDLLTVVDDFQRALTAMAQTDDIAALREGTELIFQKFYKTLESKGLKAIEAQDQPFDVDLHESVTQFSAGDDKKGIVIEELEKGYFLNEKVIRYAKVVVGN